MKTNRNTIYSKQSRGILYSPFNLNIEPMEHLILVNIEKNPDKFYKIFELQQARDEKNNIKLLVIAYRNDNSVDIYYQCGYPFAQRNNVFEDIDFIERPMKNSKFDVTCNAMDIYFSFEDKFGREVEVIVSETRRNEKKPFSILAPVGGSSNKPLSLPIYMLNQMAFTRRAHTNIMVKIDDAIHQPDTFPLPMDWSRNYFTRYSVDTFIVDWNKNYKGLLSPLMPNKNRTIENKGIRYRLMDNNGHHEIRRMSIGNEKHQLKIDFSPAVPDIICLKDGIEIEGIFVVSSDKSIGTIEGVYEIRRDKEIIHISIHPSKGWKPNEGNWLLKLFFFLAPSFKTWPSTYIWRAMIKSTDGKAPMMASSWEREEGWKEKLKSGFFTLFND